MKIKLVFILVILITAGCSKKEKIPKNSKIAGDYIVSCAGVNRGMYHCKIFSKKSKELITEKTFIYPDYHDTKEEADALEKIVKYDGDIILLNNGKKLLASDVPEDSVKMQGLTNGVWLSYKSVDDKKNKFLCTVYDMKTGNVYSSGVYALKKFYIDRKANRARYVDVKEKMSYLDVVYYGGIGITLRNKMVLLPEGWVDYPEGPNRGYRIKYNSDGKAVTEQEYY